MLFLLGAAALGLEIADVEGDVVIVGVEEGGWAEQADLHPGQRIVRVNGQRIESMREVETRLLVRRAGEPLQIEVEDHPFGQALVRPSHRFGLLAFGHLRSDQAESKSAVLGGYYAYSVLPVLALAAGFAYAPLGRTAFVDGLNAFTFLFGVEYDQPIVADFGFVARALAGPNIRAHDSPWTMEPATATVHVGVRFWMITVYAAGGFGPAEGFNVGGGIGASFEFGGRAHETVAL
jgi:membrane-associated protease RseP (regulator of RpoE activity)